MQFFEGIKEVEIRKENGAILIIPLPLEDPILRLGQNPIDDDNVNDASVEHDRHIYRE